MFIAILFYVACVEHHLTRKLSHVGKRHTKSRTRNNWYNMKNHFSEMKGDVGMSLHEKEGEQEDAYTETGSH